MFFLLLVELVVEAAVQPIVLSLPSPILPQVVREEEELLAEVEAVGALGGVLASHVDHKYAPYVNQIKQYAPYINQDIHHMLTK